jgi:hypothetical protein
MRGLPPPLVTAPWERPPVLGTFCTQFWPQSVPRSVNPLLHRQCRIILGTDRAGLAAAQSVHRTLGPQASVAGYGTRPSGDSRELSRALGAGRCVLDSHQPGKFEPA